MEKFIRDLTRTSLWYRDELIDLLVCYDLQEYVSAIEDDGMKRWYPDEVIALMETVHASWNASSEKVDASVKHIPSFLPKQNG